MKTSALALTAALAALAAGEASAHARLIKAEPRAAATVAAPHELKLTFSERIVAASSSVTLKGPAGPVHLGKMAVEPKTRHLVTAPVPDTLKPGAYKVDWTMATEDGHTMRGGYAFQVK